MAEHCCGLLTVNVNAVVRNWLRLQRELAPLARCGAVVKANAYGLGVAPIANALQAQGCREFFVATLDEGLALRALLGGDAAIVVLGGVLPGFEEEAIAADLWPSLWSVEAVERWLNCQQRIGRDAGCVLKVNTGMTRAGLDGFELEQLLARPDWVARLQVKIFMSHLACADEPLHPLNAEQLTGFKLCTEKVQAVWPQAQLSLANSSGIFLGRDWHQQLARPGAAMYGVNPCPGQPNPMESVVTLALPVLQYRHLEKSVAVGYGATYAATAGQRLAVAMGGYADGLHRQLSNRGVGELAGVKVPQVGRVSMDATVFDVTAVPEAQLPAIGEAYIEVLNAQITVSEQAQKMNTIGYEVLTSLGQRYLRRYIYEGELTI